jgi:hypothetical protein
MQTISIAFRRIGGQEELDKGVKEIREEARRTGPDWAAWVAEKPQREAGMLCKRHTELKQAGFVAHK